MANDLKTCELGLTPAGDKSLLALHAAIHGVRLSAHDISTVLGAAELAGGLTVILGVLAQLAAIGLILIMLGAIQRKIFCLAHRLLG